jgi:hypothetical protein
MSDGIKIASTKLLCQIKTEALAVVKLSTASRKPLWVAGQWWIRRQTSDLAAAI